METTKKSTFKVLFYLKKNAPKKNGKVTVMCRITVNGKQSAFSTKLDISASNWDLKYGRVLGKSREAQEVNGKLVGIAVHYIIPFMHNLKPSLMLKWLYVDTGQRGKNIGRRLLKGLAQYALNNGYKKFNWFVLANNVDAQKFYSSLGVKPDDKWIRWTITPEKMAVLADQ